jgi:hypothetical protein
MLLRNQGSAIRGFDRQRLAIAALLGGKAGELCLQAGVQTYFQGSKLGIQEKGVISLRFHIVSEQSYRAAALATQ